MIEDPGLGVTKLVATVLAVLYAVREEVSIE